MPKYSRFSLDALQPLIMSRQLRDVHTSHQHLWCTNEQIQVQEKKHDDDVQMNLEIIYARI